jgi:hypothetical protein
MRHFSSAPLCPAACSWLFVSAAFAQAISLYVDPEQHFTIQVQSGWLAKSSDSGSASGITIAQGLDAYAQVLVQKGIDPASFLKALNDNMQLTLPGYQIKDRGPHTLAGLPSFAEPARSRL